MAQSAAPKAPSPQSVNSREERSASRESQSPIVVAAPNSASMPSAPVSPPLTASPSQPPFNRTNEPPAGEVILVQNRLAALGYLSKGGDGFWGKKSKSA